LIQTSLLYPPTTFQFERFGPNEQPRAVKCTYRTCYQVPPPVSSSNIQIVVSSRRLLTTYGNLELICRCMRSPPTRPGPPACSMHPQTKIRRRRSVLCRCTLDTHKYLHYTRTVRRHSSLHRNSSDATTTSTVYRIAHAVKTCVWCVAY
jgi:hypothetical protein